jgi:hypothetical protein
VAVDAIPGERALTVLAAIVSAVALFGAVYQVGFTLGRFLASWWWAFLGEPPKKD